MDGAEPRLESSRVPIDHVKLPVADLDASRAFYSAALAPLGFRLVYDGVTSLGFGTGDGGANRQPIAQKTISAMFELQPFDKVIVDPNATK